MGRWFLLGWFLCVPMIVTALSTIQYIHQQRCLLTECQEPRLPPLVLLPGMAQSIAAWESHVPALAKDRHVLIYEPMGIGPYQETWSDVSLPAQADRLEEILQTIWGNEAVHVTGFSLGGRIGMALGCQHPERLPKLHLAGVSLERSDAGQLQLLGWLDHLQHENLRAFAWSAILATYSPAYLMQHKKKIPLWVDSICQTHSVQGLRLLLEQAHDHDPAWSVVAMAQRLHVSGHLCVGENDILGHDAAGLANALGWDAPTIVPAAGHAVPMEAGRLWREDVKNTLR
ncbi:hypothetical protein FisN_18Hh221 [Fistulifera solaris]|uniref:AB hydrolase-1 domain-containing protein n=1 Tax=Fistulifera solaris TaxID=1519565 RepID=A0A1Z5JW23_FISSO|nr:hypothetical protein FisN_18Hh221 [Fistulifera solaris]|eukprot:GAX18008.1 hypothetical protein FisN_18Hh221 [Fistulifera solaris]